MQGNKRYPTHSRAIRRWVSKWVVLVVCEDRGEDVLSSGVFSAFSCSWNSNKHLKMSSSPRPAAFARFLASAMSKTTLETLETMFCMWSSTKRWRHSWCQFCDDVIISCDQLLEGYLAREAGMETKNWINIFVLGTGFLLVFSAFQTTAFLQVRV